MLPPYLLRTPRLTLRCPAPEDAALRKEAVDASGEHMRSFFPPKDGKPWSLEDHAQQLRRFRSLFDGDQDRCHMVFENESGRFVGEVSLLKRAGIEALEIGYWVRGDCLRRGFATEMSQAVIRCAFDFDLVKRTDLMIAPTNEASAGVARRLGFTLEGRLRDRQLAPHHPRGDLLCFTLLRSEYEGSPASRLDVRAFDFLGRPLARPQQA